jgi:hypothetical protein
MKTTITMSSRLKRREEVLSEPLPDGSGLLFDPATATAYPITESAMCIWQLCDGAHDVGSIVDDLQTRYDVDRTTVETDVLKLLEELVQTDLLDDIAASPA